jgi:hypothetical protein
LAELVGEQRENRMPAGAGRPGSWRSQRWYPWALRLLGVGPLLILILPGRRHRPADA